MSNSANNKQKNVYALEALHTTLYKDVTSQTNKINTKQRQNEENFIARLKKLCVKNDYEITLPDIV